MDNDELRNLIHEADSAFWEIIVRRFSWATTGDLSPGATMVLHLAQEEAVKEWIANNVTTQQSAVARGYRFSLFRDVDRFPDFIVKAGLTGTVASADDNGVWAGMDQPVPGAESWDNQIHWETTEEFAEDTRPA
jgi:hypothetical protein